MKSFLCIYFILKLLLKFSDFINFDDCIRKITLKYIRLSLFLSKKKNLNSIKKEIISSEIKNVGNHNHNYAHSVSGEDL